MLKWLKEYVHNFRSERAVKKSIAPREFRKLAREMMELANLAQRVMPEDEDFHVRVEKIKEEMSKLNDLAEKKEFGRLPRETRLELVRSLKESRRQLMESMHLAAPPTDTLQ